MRIGSFSQLLYESPEESNRESCAFLRLFGGSDGRSPDGAEVGVIALTISFGADMVGLLFVHGQRSPCLSRDSTEFLFPIIHPGHRSMPKLTTTRVFATFTNNCGGEVARVETVPDMQGCIFKFCASSRTKAHQNKKKLCDADKGCTQRGFQPPIPTSPCLATNGYYVVAESGACKSNRANCETKYLDHIHVRTLHTQIIYLESRNV